MAEPHARTIPALWRTGSARDDAVPAYLVQEGETWRPVSWRDAAEQVEALANGLLALGIRKGDAFAILGSTTLEWALFDYAAACVGAIVEATLKRGGSLIVAADHGNAEQMFDPETNAPHTAHTVYDVPLFIVGPQFAGRRLRGDSDAKGWFNAETRARRGRLADVLPTALDMMGLPKPPEMTGTSLLA